MTVGHRNIAVVGSREWDDLPLLHSELARIEGPWRIVSGGAVSVDRMAVEWWRKYMRPIIGLDPIIFLPRWDRYGRSAGFKRNQLVVSVADEVLAFWDGRSPGTKLTIDLANKKGLPMTVINPSNLFSNTPT